jgi:hypothetical protein
LHEKSKGPLKLKRFLRDLLASVSAFYGPVLFSCFLLVFFPRFAPPVLILNLVLPAILSLVVFVNGLRRWEPEPSPLFFLLGIWLGGPISFIAGAYLGYIGALIFLTIFYPLLFLWRRFFSQSSLQSSRIVFGISFLITGLVFWTAVSQGSHTRQQNKARLAAAEETPNARG